MIVVDGGHLGPGSLESFLLTAIDWLSDLKQATSVFLPVFCETDMLRHFLEPFQDPGEIWVAKATGLKELKGQTHCTMPRHQEQSENYMLQY